ncbi:MAG: hypothetical protein ACKVKM_03995 [Verrucomicrobiia bacterium]
MLAEFVYCYLLRPWPLRPLANWAIRQLLPAQVNFGEAVVVLNPDDPVVSGACVRKGGDKIFPNRLS